MWPQPPYNLGCFYFFECSTWEMFLSEKTIRTTGTWGPNPWVPQASQANGDGRPGRDRAPGVVNKEAIQNLLYMFEDTFLCWLGFHVIIGCKWPTTNTLRLEWTSKSFWFHDTIHKALDVDTRSLQKCMG